MVPPSSTEGWQSSLSNSGAGTLSTEPGSVYEYQIKFISCPFNSVIRTEIQEGQIVEKVSQSFPAICGQCTDNGLSGNVSELPETMQTYITQKCQNHL